jgi:hypothetical protein
MGQPPGICRQLRTTALPEHVQPLAHEPTESLSKSKLGHEVELEASEEAWLPVEAEEVQHVFPP